MSNLARPCWSPTPTPEGSPVDSLCDLARGSMGQEMTWFQLRGEESKGALSTGTPKARLLPGHADPLGGRCGPQSTPGLVERLAQGSRWVSIPKELGRVGGVGQERLARSGPLINTNKYANGGSRNALLPFQFNSSNPGAESL